MFLRRWAGVTAKQIRPCMSDKVPTYTKSCCTRKSTFLTHHLSWPWIIYARKKTVF